MKTLVACTMALISVASSAELAQASPAPHGRKHKRWSISIGSNGIGINYQRYRTPPRAYRFWVSGYWTWDYQRVEQPGTWERIWIPARYEWQRDPYGRPYRVCVEPGHYEQRWRAGGYTTHRVRRWVPGRWDYRR